MPSGFPPPAASRALRVASGFRGAGGRRAPPCRVARIPELDPEDLPRLAALGERYVALAARDTYERGLRTLVAGLLAAPA